MILAIIARVRTILDANILFMRSYTYIYYMHIAWAMARGSNRNDDINYLCSNPSIPLPCLSAEVASGSSTISSLTCLEVVALLS